MDKLLTDIKNCEICLPFLEHGVNPILSASPKSKIAIIGQAPGSMVHKTSKPWNDKSGQRLREWLGVSPEIFYEPDTFALIPMGFCYPGKGNSGDLPPRTECAPKWHPLLFEHMSHLQFIILIGNYAQKYYLKDTVQPTLTATVKDYKSYLPKYFPIPHPSPRNNIWLKKNQWFENTVLPELKQIVFEII